jgi:MFS transporter, PAT family, solute carrier family 33 (acetyl-CoA transportor), member 1
LRRVSNLGGTFPRFFILRLVDYFTVATCHPGKMDPAVHTQGPLLTEPFSCSLQSEKERCIRGGGSCEMLHDGYYIVNLICVAVGVITFVSFIRPRILQLQSLPLRAWRLAGSTR